MITLQCVQTKSVNNFDPLLRKDEEPRQVICSTASKRQEEERPPSSRVAETGNKRDTGSANKNKHSFIAFPQSIKEINPSPMFHRIAKTNLSRHMRPSGVITNRIILRSFSATTNNNNNNMSQQTYELVKVDKSRSGGRVALVELNRPKALNALCDQLCHELGQVFADIENDPNVKCSVLTGLQGSKAFAAGADIKEMKDLSYMDVYGKNLFGDLDTVAQAKKPIIAAVNGFALGGGCELAMMCDIIYASDKAKFGQPEIKLATVPGIGGTQRLTKLIGKQRAMEWVLTGDIYTADEAAKAGLVARVVEHDKLLDVALATAEKIAAYSAPITQLAKQCVNKADEVSLQEGLSYEKRVFQSTFATEDQKEGMTAFAEKREAQFKNQ